jgi:hypothetical protein
MGWIVLLVLVVGVAVLWRPRAGETWHRGMSLAQAAALMGQIGEMADLSLVALHCQGRRRVSLGKRPDGGVLEQEVLIWVEEAWAGDHGLDEVFSVVRELPTVSEALIVETQSGREIQAKLRGSPAALSWKIARSLVLLSEVLDLGDSPVDVCVRGGMSRRIWRRVHRKRLASLRDDPNEPWLVSKVAEWELRKADCEERGD